MAPATFDIKYYKGDSYSLILYPKTAAQVPYDLTGFSASLDIADKRGSGAVQAWSLSTLVDTDADTILCTITPTVGNEFDVDKIYYYDVTASNGSGIVHTFVTGAITVTESVGTV